MNDYGAHVRVVLAGMSAYNQDSLYNASRRFRGPHTTVSVHGGVSSTGLSSNMKRVKELDEMLNTWYRA